MIEADVLLIADELIKREFKGHIKCLGPKRLDLEPNRDLQELARKEGFTEFSDEEFATLLASSQPHCHLLPWVVNYLIFSGESWQEIVAASVMVNDENGSAELWIHKPGQRE